VAEAGTWRNGRRKPPEAPPSPPPSIPLPSLRLSPRLRLPPRLRLAPRLRLLGPLTLPVILRAAALPLAYLLLALAGIAAGLALASAVGALAGRTLFHLPPLAAQLILVGAPLLGLLPLSFLLLGAPSAPALRAHLWRLIALWALCAALFAFAFGVLPFLR
jgi:hypothetical protein